ncbi:TPA: Xylosyltransferase 2 [Trebouxia sp. C0004]
MLNAPSAKPLQCICLFPVVAALAGALSRDSALEQLDQFPFFLGDDHAPEPSDAEGVRSCSNALQGFYNSSKQLFDLDAGNWQESETDTTLCKAGLWGCHRPVSNTSYMKCSTAAVAAEQDQVRVAFIIMASDNSWKGAPDVSLLRELLRALDHPAFYVVVQIDQNSSRNFKDAAAALAAQHTRTSLARYPLGCTWAGASITASQLSAMADIYYGDIHNDDDGRCVDLIINLSNSDFPVKTAQAIEKGLADSVHHVHFDFFGKEGSSDTFNLGPDPTQNPKDHHMFYLPECWSRPVSIRRKDVHPHHRTRRHPDLESWQIVESSQFWVLSREALHYLMTNKHVQYLWHYLQHTPVTDESFVSTAIYNNAALNATVREGTFKYIGKRDLGRLVHEADQEALASCKYLFARKFMSGPEALRLTNASKILCT